MAHTDLIRSLWSNIVCVMDGNTVRLDSRSKYVMTRRSQVDQNDLSASFTLYACSGSGGTIKAELLDENGRVVARDSKR